jgi:FlaA1/EpsC-like NDP-sugar epimerase
MRPGEKMHEVLVSEEEMWRATELDKYFLIPSWARSQANVSSEKPDISEYSSNCTHQLAQDEILHMLESDGWFGTEAQAKAAHGVEINEY